jgi:hypothetical protein
MRPGMVKLILLFCLVAGMDSVNAQSPSSTGVGKIIALVDSFNQRMPAEKLFLHFDKPYYAIGDTIWFKAYLFQAATHAWSPISGLLYIELINDSSRQIRRIRIPVNYGVSWGQIPLTGDDLPAGNYTLRGYSRWMQNFGEEAFFHRRIFIAPATIPELKARNQASGRKSHLSDLQPPSRTDHFDLQFMPEGGWLVAGIPSRVGFKAIGEDGLGRDVKGTIIDGKGNSMLAFQSLYKGMGKFELQPMPGERYAALIEMTDGSTRRFPLPEARKSGYIIRVDNRQGSDSVHVSVLVSADHADGRSVHLLGLSRGVVCFAANMRLSKTEADGMVPKQAFPSGIAHFTLFNDANEPLCERLTYIDHQDELNIQLSTDIDSYHTRDSIPLNIRVTNAEGQPVTGSFSLAVTDDGQVKADNSRAGNIISHILLTSGLNGFVENPAWYFSNRSGESWQALDALLLTQGWIGYYWKDILHGYHEPIYAAEPGFQVTGKVTNLTNSPVRDAKVTLISTGRTELAMDTVTGADGRFVFCNFPPMDSTGFVVQARNAKGKSFGIDVSIDEFKPTVLSAQTSASGSGIGDPGRDSILYNYVQNNEAIQNAKDPYGGRYKSLQKVVVRANPVIRGSHNLNGTGQADQVIDEATIMKAGKMTLKELLLEKVKGFRVTYSKTGIEQYMIIQNRVRIVIDGLSLSRFGVGQERETLEFLTAEDITGIEVMYTPKNTAGYNSTLVSGRQLMSTGREFAFLEITTRSGNGIFQKKSPGVTTYRPIPVTWPQAFYTPRYPVKQNGSQMKDLRATIHWQPSLVTDRKGNASTSFYAADTPSSYTIVVQGSDMDGNIGFGMKQILITR